MTNDFLLTVDKGESSILVLLDLSAGFDTGDHSIRRQHLEAWSKMIRSQLVMFLSVCLIEPFLFLLEIPHLLFPISLTAFPKAHSWVCCCSQFICCLWVTSLLNIMHSTIVMLMTLSYLSF